jgi:hypothetical protein
LIPSKHEGVLDTAEISVTAIIAKKTAPTIVAMNVLLPAAQFIPPV